MFFPLCSSLSKNFNFNGITSKEEPMSQAKKTPIKKMSKKKKNLKRYSLEKKLDIKLEEFLNSIFDIAFIIDRDFKIMFISHTAKGFDRKKVIGTSVFDYLSKAEQAKQKDVFEKIFLSGTPAFYESQSYGDGKKAAWYSSVAGPVCRDGKVIAITVVCHDITSKKTYEESLLKNVLSKKNKDPAPYKLPDQIFLVNKEGRFLDFSLSKDFPLYVSPERFLGKKIEDVMPEDVAWKTLKKLKAAFLTKKPQEFEYELNQDDKTLAFEARLFAVNKKECLIIVRNNTDTKDYLTEFLYLMAQEQKRIGHDLHDGLSQHLTGIAFLGKVLEKNLLSKGLAEANEARKIVVLVNDAIDHTRYLARGLHLVELETSSLKDAIAELAARTEKIYKIRCSLNFEDSLVVEDVDTKMHVYRIIQEAVSNSIKHGKVKKIKIEAKKKQSYNRFSISDDGVGISEAVVEKGAGTGLKIMQYRAKVIGANLDVLQNKSGGTRVNCDLFCKEGGKN